MKTLGVAIEEMREKPVRVRLEAGQSWFDCDGKLAEATSDYLVISDAGGNRVVIPMARVILVEACERLDALRAIAKKG